jgi:hypothetical protein
VIGIDVSQVRLDRYTLAGGQGLAVTNDEAGNPGLRSPFDSHPGAHRPATQVTS